VLFGTIIFIEIISFRYIFFRGYLLLPFSFELSRKNGKNEKMKK